MLVFSLTLTALPVGAQSTIAVVPFENVNGDRSLDWLSAGIPETITNSLLAVKGIVLVDRVQLRKVMDEQKFQWSGMADERTAVKLGKIAGASIMVVGAMNAKLPVKPGNFGPAICFLAAISIFFLDSAPCAMRKYATQEL